MSARLASADVIFNRFLSMLRGAFFYPEVSTPNETIGINWPEISQDAPGVLKSSQCSRRKEPQSQAKGRTQTRSFSRNCSGCRNAAK